MHGFLYFDNPIRKSGFHATALVLLGTMCLGLLVACGSSKELAKTGKTKKYERPPIVETTDEKLKTEAMLIDAKMKQELGKETDAAELYGMIISRDPECDAACYELSRLLSGIGMTDSAIVLAKRATAIDKGNKWYQLHLASLYRYTNQMEACIKTWENIVASNPDVLEFYYELSNMYLQNNDIKGAINTLNRVEKRVGVTETVSVQKAKLWNHLGNEAKATQEIETLAKNMPKDSRYNAMLAETYMSAKQYQKAKECYDRILAANPDDEYVHINLAEYYKAMKQPEKAYQELKKGLSHSSLSTKNKVQILTTFYSSEEFYGSQSEYAYDLLETALAGSNDSTTFAAFHGDALMRQGKHAEAAKQFRLSLTADSSKYEIWEALLVSELSSGTDTAMLGCDARRASRLFPLHPLPYYMQAIVEHDNERYSEAVGLLKKCEDLGFDKGYLEAETYMLMAECYNRMDDSRCYGYYEKYLKLHPDDVQVLNSYAYRLALDNKELEKAETMSRKTIEVRPDNPYFLDTYAWVLHRLGRDKEALKYIEKAIQRDEESEEVKEHYEAIKESIR